MFFQPTFWALIVLGAILYWRVQRSTRLWGLLALSAGYLLLKAPYALLTMGAVAAVVFAFASRGTDAVRRWQGRMLVAVCLALLLALRHVPWLRGGALLEGWAGQGSGLGGSYFAFKMIHVVIESGRGHLCCDSLPLFLVYAFLLPIFCAGPIQRYDLFVAGQKPRLTFADTVRAVRRIFFGVIKKVVVAHLLFRLAGGAMGAGPLLTGSSLDAWYQRLIRLVRSYADFSGYSDLAIGSSALFGFTIQENFNYPLVAGDIADFWRRWHMTLVGWCRAYVYLPFIALTRRPYVAILLTFSVIGLWHSLSLRWLLWGVYHAVGVSLFVSFRRVARRLGWTWPDHPLIRPLGTVITLLFVAAAGTLTWPAGELDLAQVARMFGKLGFVH